MNKASPAIVAPIILSIHAGDFPEEMNALIDCGADVNTCEDGMEGMSILMQCASYQEDRTQIARLLVRRGADVFLRDDDGHDAEYHAQRSEHAALSDLDDFLADVKQA